MLTKRLRGILSTGKFTCHHLQHQTFKAKTETREWVHSTSITWQVQGKPWWDDNRKPEICRRKLHHRI